MLMNVAYHMFDCSIRLCKQNQVNGLETVYRMQPLSAFDATYTKELTYVK